MEDDFVGAIKIKDGLFIGDEYAAQDFEFVVTNKVTHIINCAGKQIPNYWESVGVMYLTYDWDDSETQVVFDSKLAIIDQILSFVEEAASMGEGVLVHSVKGQSRSCCVLTAYFMKRYKWSLYKTLEFLTSRRSDLEIRTSFYHQLLDLESRLAQQTDGNVTVNWHEVAEHSDGEELILRNTFLNARSAPFDEALVNPQLGVDNRPRKLNWGDEKPAHKGGLALYLGKESLAAMMAKPALSSVKSILKGSNKVFKLKASSSMEESSSPVLAPVKEVKSAGLKNSKSTRNFSDSRASEPVVEDISIKTPVDSIKETFEKNQEPVLKAATKGPNMSRSSSTSIIEKEENFRSSAKGSFFAANDKNDKQNNNSAKVSNINGNIIHLTVNNYLVPVDNASSTAQANTSGLKVEAEKPKQSSVSSVTAPKGLDSRPPSQKYSLASDGNREELEKNIALHPDNSPVRSANTPSADRSSLSTNHLKSAIEKKLSKEYKSQLASSTSAMAKGGLKPVTAKSFTNDRLEAKATLKEYSRPTEIKVNYQVLLRNRETPPPRKRDENKKVLESPLRKTSKSSFTTKHADNSGLPYSSYLNNLFSTSLSHLNTMTPSGYGTNSSNIEKKTPISTKGTPVSYNLAMSQKSQPLTRPQRSNVNQNFTSSLLATSFSKSKLLGPTEPSSATNLSSKYNNYITQPAKGTPVRVTYEPAPVDRPHSATPNRSVTPQSGLKRFGTTSSGFGVRTSDQRSSAPLKGGKSISSAKKELGLSQDMLMSKYRQRSSSPLQVSYNPVLSSSSISLKSRPKY